MRAATTPPAQRSDRRHSGAAIVEFALVLPFFVVIVFGLMELTFRLQATEKFHRYLTQAADYLSRAPELFSDDITQIYNRAPEMMQPVRMTGGNLGLTVSSIGFTAEDNAVLLWQRTRGTGAATVTPNDAIGLGVGGETVLRVDASFTYRSVLAFALAEPEMTLTGHVYYRPRRTRVIAIDGIVSENGTAWDDGTETGSNEGTLEIP